MEPRRKPRRPGSIGASMSTLVSDVGAATGVYGFTDTLDTTGEPWDVFAEALPNRIGLPAWTFFLIGVFGGSLALVAATGSVLAYLADRWLRK